MAAFSPPAGGPGVTEDKAGEAADAVMTHGSVVALDASDPASDLAGNDTALRVKTDPELPRGVLISGRSGQGKSALALALMAFGARLVADDRVLLEPRNGRLIATCPAALSGLVEARGIGLLRARCVPRAALMLVVDLDHEETERLPHPRFRHIAGVSLPCLHKIDKAYFPAAILQYLKAGRVETQ